MILPIRAIAGVLLVGALFTAGGALAHITPPVVLVSERDALASQLAGAKKLSLREVSLTPEERKAVQATYGWRAQDEVYPVYMGRDDAGKLLGASLFVTEATIHGTIRVAVALTPDGRVKSAEVVELAEEIYAQMRPLMERGFTKRFTGLAVGSSFEPPAASGSGADALAQHYDSLVGRMVQHAVILYNVGVMKRGVT